MDAIALLILVIWITEWGISATHVHRNNRDWTRVHLFDLIAGKGKVLPDGMLVTQHYSSCEKFWTRLARETDGHNIDKFHVASFCSHFPVAIYMLWGHPWWAWVIAAIGAQLIWRLVIATSGIGWESFWLRFFRRFKGGD